MKSSIPAPAEADPGAEKASMFASALASQFLLLVFALQCLGAGFCLASRFSLWRGLADAQDNAFSRAFFALSAGLAMNIVMLFFAGLLGRLSWAEPISLASLAAMLAAPGWRRAALGTWRSRRAEPGDIGLMVLLYLSTNLLAVHPPGFFDDTMYHLPLARFYAAHGAIALDPWVRFPLFPQNQELLMALAFSWRAGDAILAQGMTTLPGFGVCLGLMGAGLALRSSRGLGAFASLA